MYIRIPNEVVELLHFEAGQEYEMKIEIDVNKNVYKLVLIKNKK